MFGHLLASAGWLLSTWLFAVQFMHLRLCGQWPSAEVSIVSPYSFAVLHLWQLAGLVGWCSFLLWWPLQMQQHCVSVRLFEVQSWTSWTQVWTGPDTKGPGPGPDAVDLDPKS